MSMLVSRVSHWSNLSCLAQSKKLQAISTYWRCPNKFRAFHSDSLPYIIFIFSDEHAGIEGIKLEQLKMLSSIKEITGYLNIQEAPEQIKNLTFLRNLEIIRGRHLS